MAEQRPSLAGSGRCRQGRAPPRNSRQDNVRNRLLSAQRAFDARTLQRSRSLALGRRKSAALAARCRHERGSGSQSFGKRPPQSRRSPPHGLERHAKGWGKRLAPGQVQASRLGRTLPCPTPNPVLKCDRPGSNLTPEGISVKIQLFPHSGESRPTLGREAAAGEGWLQVILALRLRQLSAGYGTLDDFAAKCGVSRGTL